MIKGPHHLYGAYGMYGTRTGPTSLGDVRLCQFILLPPPQLSIRDLTFLLSAPGWNLESNSVFLWNPRRIRLGLHFRTYKGQSLGSQLLSTLIPKEPESGYTLMCLLSRILLISRPSDLSFIPFSLPNGGGGDSWDFGCRVGRL